VAELVNSVHHVTNVSYVVQVWCVCVCHAHKVSFHQ